MCGCKTSGSTNRAAPPVRTRVTGELSSASMRWTMPSSIAAMPTMVPERMHSSVFLPMMRSGVWRFCMRGIAGNKKIAASRTRSGDAAILLF